MFYKIGEISAFITAISWTLSALIFEKASKKAGVTATNTLKVFFGTIYLAILAFFIDGKIISDNISMKSFLFMSASGVIGFVIGDYFLFNAYVMVGSRLSMLLMSISVPITAIFSFIFFKEKLELISIAGIITTVIGISITILSGKKNEDNEKKEYIKGTIFGILSGVAMAFGTLLTKAGSYGVSPILATQIRVFSALIGFIIYSFIFNKHLEILNAIKDAKSLFIISMGSIFGPFIGVGALLYAIQKAPAGIVATISSLTPVLIILPSVFIYKKKVLLGEVLGAIIAFLGIVMIFR